MNTILVTLPRECGGQEILDAFRAAATFQETPTRKWEAHGYTSASGAAAYGNTFSSMHGYYATPAYLHEQGRISRLLHGRRSATWKTISGQDVSRFETQIHLHALQPEKKYAKVEISLTHLVPIGPYSEAVRVIHSPDAEEFKVLRPSYDRIIREFLKRIERS